MSVAMDEVGVVKLFGFDEVDLVMAVESCNAGIVRGRESKSMRAYRSSSTAGDPLE